MLPSKTNGKMLQVVYNLRQNRQGPKKRVAHCHERYVMYLESTSEMTQQELMCKHQSPALYQCRAHTGGPIPGIRVLGQVGKESAAASQKTKHLSIIHLQLIADWPDEPLAPTRKQVAFLNFASATTWETNCSQFDVAKTC